MWQELNIKKLAVLLLPIRRRVLFNIYFIWAFLEPINDIYYWWVQFRKDNLYKLSHNGQICYLRAVLNDRFDPVLRRIVITGSQRYEKEYIYTVAERKDRYLGAIYLRQDSDYEDNGADFLVLVPAELLDNENYEMKALIDLYRLGSKRYKIEIL